MDLLDVWAQAMAFQVRAVNALSRATNRVSRVEYDALRNDVIVIRQYVVAARAAYQDHRVEHGCDPPRQEAERD